LPLTYETFDEIRKLNPLTVDGLLLKSAAPESYDTWEKSNNALIESVEEGTGLLGDFNNDGRPDRALPLMKDGVVYLVVASFHNGRWYLPGHCFQRLDREDVVNRRKLDDLATDACILEEREEYALLWRFWDRDFRAGEQAYKAGSYDEALGFFKSSLQEARKVRHPDWRLRASLSLQSIAESYLKTGRPQDALQTYREAVEILESDEGSVGSSTDLEVAVRKLASALQRQRRTEESVEAYTRALSLHEENRCGLSPDVTKADILFEISSAYSEAGQLDQALSYLQKAELQYRTSYFAPGMHWDTPAYALKLGREYRRLGEPQKAVEMFEYGLQEWSRMEGASAEDRDELQAELEALKHLRDQS
jgi:tetratricopeptide (TPR) repeat protein